MISLLPTLLLSGCLVHTAQHDDGTRTDYYLGYTTVKSPVYASSEAHLEVKQVENFGLGFVDGFILGYTSQKRVTLPPGNGLYLENLTEEQYDAILEILLTANEQKTPWILEKKPATAP